MTSKKFLSRLRKGIREMVIIRKVDDFGRILIPKEFRQELGIEYGEVLQTSVQKGKIIIEKKSDKITVNTSAKENIK